MLASARMPGLSQLLRGHAARLGRSLGRASRALSRLGGDDPDALDAHCTYEGDNLKVWHKNTAFLRDPRFRAAYERGMDSGHKIGRAPGSKDDIHIEWRVHVACWAASHARHLPGDFVECGVNTGTLSLAVCEWVDFNATGKRLFLFDTFRGIPPEQVSPREAARGRLAENELLYEECYKVARRNFAPFPRAQLIRGRVPDTLGTVDIPQVSYLSLDMNIAEPEVAAMHHFWPRLVPGALVLLDDYGWLAYVEQKEALDGFAAAHDVQILTLPTGQGLLVKP